MEEEHPVTNKYFRNNIYLRRRMKMELSLFFKSIIEQDCCAVVICNLEH